MKIKIGLVALAVLLVFAASSCTLIDSTNITGTWKTSIGGVSILATFDGAGNLSTTLNGSTSITGGKYLISANQITLSNCSSLGLLDGTYSLYTPSAVNMQWQVAFVTVYDWTKQ